MLPLIDAVEAAQHVQQRALADADAPTIATISPLDRQIQIAEHDQRLTADR